MDLPRWMDKHLEAWTGFCQMRQEMAKKHRVPFTERAMKVTITSLEKLMWDGYDPSEVLDQSVQRGWKGVFAVYGQQPKRVLRDQHGTYEVTAEGTRQYLRFQ